MNRDLRKTIAFAEIENWEFTRKGKNFAVFERVNNSGLTKIKLTNLKENAIQNGLLFESKIFVDKVVVCIMENRG